MVRIKDYLLFYRGKTPNQEIFEVSVHQIIGESNCDPFNRLFSVEETKEYSDSAIQ